MSQRPLLELTSSSFQSGEQQWQVEGYEYEEIAVITGHQSVDSLVRYINVRNPEVFERFCGAWE